jgi:polyphenol oxidase
MTPPFKRAEILKSDQVAHGFFGRKGGVSTGLYESLNLGPGSADLAANVADNRARVARALGARALVSGHQTHSAIALEVTRDWGAQRPECDALVTREPGLAICALAADCAPVLLMDVEAGLVGAAHAGWKGAQRGVIEACVAKMESLGAQPRRIRAAVGPCLSRALFEVGPEFVDSFMASHPGSEDLFDQGSGDRAFFDLKTFCLRRLAQCGVTQVQALPDCTLGGPEHWFSYRGSRAAGQTDYGRNGSAICLLMQA